MPVPGRSLPAACEKNKLHKYRGTCKGFSGAKPITLVILQRPDYDRARVELGCIAQDVEQIPELARAVWSPDASEEPQPKSLEYNALFTLNLQATQELAALVESQAAIIAALDGRVTALEEAAQGN